MTTNPPWIRFKDQRPTKAGLFEWRVPSSTAPGMVLIVAAEMRMRGAGGTDVLSPEFDYWDGYRVLVQCDVEWRPTDFVPGKYQRTPAVLGIEGLELSRCSRCGTVPSITAHQAHPQGGVLSNPAPWRLNSWKFVCCAWGETPPMNDPREIERLRRETRGRAAPDLLEALETLVECAKYGDVIQGADAWKDARAAIAKAKGEQPRLDAGLPRAAFPHMSPAEYLAERLREDDEDLQDLMDRDMGADMQMIRRLLRALPRLDRYEWVGIAGGVVVLAAVLGVLGPTLDAQSTLTACEGCGKTAVAAKD